MASLSPHAWQLAVLHACKHPSAAVGGFLLGPDHSGGGVEFTDAVPVFHSVPTPPMLSVARDAVDAYARTKSMKIVGVYFASEAAGDLCKPKFVDAMATLARSPLVLTLQAKRLDTDPCGCWQLWSGSSNLALTVADGCTRGVLATALASLPKLADFDDHLDDASHDWRNTWLP